MKENISQVIVDVGIDELTFSIDGATDKTFRDIRGKSIESLLGNIRKLNKIKEKMNSQKPKLIFNMILMKSNIEEIVTLINLAKEYGVEEVNFQHLVVFKGLDISDESVFWMDHNYANQLMDKALERAEELDIKVIDMPKFPDADLGKKKIISKVKSLFLPDEDFLCIKPWVAVVFTPKGDVLPCFGWFNEECMGNIVENSFDEIWNSERYRKLREEHRGNAKMRMHCKRCSFLASRRYDESAFEEREIKLV